MRFQPRFEVDEAGERMFKRVAETPADVVNFLRQYIERANK